MVKKKKSNKMLFGIFTFLIIVTALIYWGSLQSTYTSDDSFTNDFVNYSGDVFDLATNGNIEVTTYAQIEGDVEAVEVTVFPYWYFSTVASLYQRQYMTLNVWNVETQVWEDFYYYERLYTSFGTNGQIGRGIYYNETPYLFEVDKYVCAVGDIAPEGGTCYFQNNVVGGSGYSTWIVMPYFTFNESYIDEGIVRFNYNLRASYDTMVDQPSTNDHMGMDVLNWGLPKFTYYYFDNETNDCTEVLIEATEVTENHYLTEELCSANIVAPVSSGGGGGSASVVIEEEIIVPEETNITENFASFSDKYLFPITGAVVGGAKDNKIALGFVGLAVLGGVGFLLRKRKWFKNLF